MIFIVLSITLSLLFGFFGCMISTRYAPEPYANATGTRVLFAKENYIGMIIGVVVALVVSGIAALVRAKTM